MSRLPFPRILLRLCLLLLVALPAALAARPFAPAPIEGRWDLTLTMGGKELPAWLEVRHSGVETLVGQFVGAGGSARPVARVEFAAGQVRFALPPQWEKGKNDLRFEGRLQGDALSGTVTFPDGERGTWTGVRAPSLRREREPAWGQPVALLDANSLSGWRVQGDNQWQVAGGVLRNAKSGGNLVSEKTFTDFKLHVEFRYPAGSNSGVYLRGRYEVQIADSTTVDPAIDELGSIYGFVAPTFRATRAGEWQTFDITLVGRRVTVVLNGKTIICDREIPGITGGAINSREGDPGPLLLQGDHGPVEYRNITVTPAK
jgi:hypothetical protein